MSSRSSSYVLPLYQPSHEKKARFHAVRTALTTILKSRESRSIFIFLVINLFFMFVELLYGIWTNSLGLVSDACHMLFDSTALAIGLLASIIAQWEPNQSFSYGYGRIQVLSGFINAVFLVFISISVFLEAIERIWEPPEIHSKDRLLIVSLLGFFVNLLGVFAFSDAHAHSHGGHGHSHGSSSNKKDDDDLTHKKKDSHSHSHSHGKKEKKHKHSHSEEEHHHDHHHDHDHHDHDHHDHDHGHSHDHDHDHHHDEHKEAHDDFDFEADALEQSNDSRDAIFLHLLADTMGSVAVIVSSTLIHLFGWTVADPICSFLLSLMIFASVIPLLKKSAQTLLQRTPHGFERILKDCLQKVVKIEGVTGYSEPHFWNHDGTAFVGTIHVQISNETNEQKVLSRVLQLFKLRGISQLTVQVEKDNFWQSKSLYS
eukprot:TRINITY_DN2327_c0_g1_i1.p1 TRINITY_DN2327_c0_g1~~TRINITY_DN2327_c0_g1_i1.p1  ORF type:complete len:428 (+),score=64.25 TRINITY_DN2327_c0_g1_i1:74-1357(+)